MTSSSPKGHFIFLKVDKGENKVNNWIKKEKSLFHTLSITSGLGLLEEEILEPANLDLTNHPTFT